MDFSRPAEGGGVAYARSSRTMAPRVLIAVAAAVLLALAGTSLLVGIGLRSREKPVFRADWAVCMKGDRCVAVATPCGWTAVNGRHKTDADLYYAYLATVIEVRCSGDVPNRPPAAQCRAGRCILDRAVR